MKKIKNQFRIYSVYSKKSCGFDIIKGGLTVFISVLIIFTVVQAGSITPPVGAPSAQFYTLSEIYEFITNNTTATEDGHNFTFSDDLSGTRHTLTEIYSALANLISADKVKLDTTYLSVAGTLVPSGGDATTADVLDGKTFFGDSQADWNLQTGTMTNVGAQTITPTITNQTITQGYHDGAGYCEGDANLISTNIKSGITIFGIDGNGNVVDTSSGDAVASDTLSGKIAWVDGSEIIGTMPTQTLSNANETVSAGYYAATTLSAVDADLATGNIKSGITIFGIDGNGNVVDTSSGDAIAGDTLSGKISWVDGIEITGDMPTQTLSNANDTVSAGYYAATTLSAVDSDLTAGNLKFDVNLFGIAGTYSGYPGTGWSGSGLTETACGTAGDWEWFEDANGDGDTTDSEDGICVKTTAVLNTDNLSWNGGEQITPNNLGATPITAGTANSATKNVAGWVVNAYKNHVVKVTDGGGAAINCWGRVKSNTADTITVYGSWLGTDYNVCGSNPAVDNNIAVFDDWGDYDNSWIGDWTCVGSFADGDGEPAFQNYPTPTQVANGKHIALATADCYDGVRDLLPNETDRAVISGTATATDSTSITHSSLGLDINVWIGQKVLITGGTGIGAYGFVESNIADVITVTDWLDSEGNSASAEEEPAIGSEFKIIYIVPHATYVPDAEIDGVGDDYDDKANNGPLMAEYLKEWKGTRLPTSNDFFGFCSCGGTNVAGQYEITCSADKTCGNRGGQIGRTSECIDPVGWEWLSEQHYYYSARVAGDHACSYLELSHVSSGYRFRGVFRP